MYADQPCGHEEVGPTVLDRVDVFGTIEGAEPAGRLRAGSPTTGRTVRRSLSRPHSYVLEHCSLDLAHDFPCDGRHAGFQTQATYDALQRLVLDTLAQQRRANLHLSCGFDVFAVECAQAES